jgi:hypothetical protein
VATIEVLEPAREAACPKVRFALEAPAAGELACGQDIEIRGWAFCQESPVEFVELDMTTGQVKRLRLDRPRPDVAAHFAAPAAEQCGFAAVIETQGMPPLAEIAVAALLQDGSRTPLAVLRWRESTAAGRAPLRPLMVVSMGRMGTTWFLRLLSKHPGVLVPDKYPHEFQQARYWLEMHRFLRAPGETGVLAAPPPGLGWLPFGPRQWDLQHFPALRWWLDHGFGEGVLAFCRQTIETFYRRTAEDQDRPEAVYFAEKSNPDLFDRLIRPAYPEARQVVLIRDFRDMVCSARSFNAKRGWLSFRRNEATSDDEHVRLLAQDGCRLLEHWRRFHETALMVRYEDLITRPAASLRQVFDYLALDADTALLARILREASEDTPDMQYHRTSESAARSIGRWRRDLEPALRALCQQEFGAALAGFGYEPEELHRCA